MELYSGICQKRGGVGTEKVDHLPELLLLADGSGDLRTDAKINSHFRIQIYLGNNV